jgi:formylglycine-generating enzyme required for sulfatase activity
MALITVLKRKSNSVLSVPIIAAFCATIVALAACDESKLGFQGPKDGAAALLEFAGVESINKTPDGHYALVWNHVKGLKDVAAVSYEIYMDKWDALPSDLQQGGKDGFAVQANATGDGIPLGARLADMADSDGPATKGVLLSSVRGVRSYMLDERIQPHTIYAFQVRSVKLDGTRDTNSKVLIYSADFNKIEFNGVTGLSQTTAGKLLLEWAEPTDLAGLTASDITYEIYMDSTQDSVEKVVASGSLAVGQVGLTGDASAVGSQLVTLPNERLPSTNTAPVAERKGGHFYEIEAKLTAGLTYIFQVVARGPGGEQGISARALAYRVEALQFDGIKPEGAAVAADSSKITLTWSAATGSHGTVSYIIYADANFDKIIATTTSTTFDFANPTPGTSYVFAVRAQDGDLFDTNRRFVIVPVADPSDKTPPVFAGIKSAETVSDKKILLKWDASPSADVALYNVYNAFNLNQAIASTSETYYTVSGLTAATSYTFVVRAKDTSNNEEKNNVQKSAATLSYTVPDFAGIASVDRLGGTDGLTKLKVSWQRAGGLATGYKIYMAAAAGGEIFSTPIATVADSMVTETTISGLESAVTYYFIVRAYYTSGGTTSDDLNTVEKSSATLGIKAPTFAGATSATAEAGSLGLSSIKVAWPAPQTDGVYDGFAVTFEAGTCAQAFTGAATTVNIAGDTQRDYIVNGLTAATTYRFRARARYSITNITDTNTICREGITTPPAPIFSGISTVATMAGVQGFDSLNLTWPKAQSSFTYYKIEWSATADFAAVLGNSQIANVDTLSTSIFGLPSKTIIYVRIAATFDEGGVLLKAGQTKVLSAKTEPPSPLGEGVSNVTVLAADSLKVVWTAPTNAGGVYSGYKLWNYCGASAATNLLAKVSGAADQSYGAGQLEATFAGLASNVQCCYQVRAFYNDGTNTLASQSTVAQKCATPTLTAPTFAGITSVTNNNLATGFTQLTVNWTPVSAGDAGLFSFYEIDYATTISGQTWASPIQILDRTQTSYALTGLTENTTYYVRIRAVNNGGSPSVNSGSNAVQSALTTPKTPTGDNLSAATSIGSTKAMGTYAPPGADPAVGGLYNNTFFFIQAGTTTDLATYRTSVETGGVTTGEVGYVLSAGKATLTALPALVRIPKSEIPGATNNLEIWGLTPNQQVCIQAAAVYWVDGQPTRYLKSASATTRCVTPTAGAPTFAGVTSLTGFENSQDFTQMQVHWGAIGGDCTRVDISATLTANSPNFATPLATATCGESVKTIAGLSPHQEYFIQVRAVNEVAGVTYAAGQGTELSRIVRPTVPSGDTTSNAVATSQLKALDSIAVTYVEATAGIWNQSYIWKSTASSQVAAEAAVRTAAATKTDHSGPTSAPFAIKATGNTLHTDATAEAGVYACYIARSVYADGTYYNSSSNDVVKCARPTYSAPTFTGVASAAVIGTWPDGTAKVELTFIGTPAGSIEEYWVYYSQSSSLGSFHLTDEPWQKIDLGDATYDVNSIDNKILVGGKNVTVAGSGYFLVRYKFYFGPATDVDVNTAVSTGVTIPQSQANLALIPTSVSGLGYEYYMMLYEASTASGTYSAEPIDVTAQSEDNIATCAYEFHEHKTPWHSSCGTKNTTATVKSTAGSTPVTATWAQAQAACHNSSGNSFLMRLPTQEEWARATKWVGTSYNTMWSVYSAGTAGNCVISGAAANTGSAASCKSATGLFDVAGNLREWVDARMLPYSISGNTESRFSYGPTIGLTQRNGIDNVTRRYHLITPGASGLALALGADYSAASPADRKQYGASSVQTWQDATTTTATGFRCLAFAAGSAPVMDVLAQPTEPVYASTDYSGAASTWTIPENFYVKDTKPETLAITVNGNTADATAEGDVTITWKPWTKTVCTPTCVTTAMTGATYRIYRFVEPTRSSERLATPWALAGGFFNPYSADKPLDPLAVDGSGNLLYTAATADGRLIKEDTNCTSTCTFTDNVSAGTGFSVRKIYDYLIVAIDSDGNQATAMTQYWRSPFFAGTPAIATAASFRLEPRFRRAAVFLVDEAHQQAQTQPQIMVHVPMDKSGLDHDFFMQKYEASGYGGSVVNNSPAGPPSSADFPLQATAGGSSWLGSAGKCQDLFQRTADVSDVTACGNGTVVNTTSRTVQSKQGIAPLVSIDQGAFWKSCRNTTLSDDSGNIYALSLPSDAEWMKAADWGDLDQNGTIDIGVNSGLVSATLENAAADGTTVRCHTDNNPASAYSSNSANTANCRTRYGAADMVGNVWEWTTGQIFTGAGLDNGTDGLWFGQSLPTASNAVAAIGGKYNLFRAFPHASAGSVIADNVDYYYYNTALRGAIRGGNWYDTTNAGRWSLYLSLAPSGPNTFLGGRCRR